jgi:hypothetical protein
MMIVKVKIEDRGDGGIRVSSDELPGLILSGRNRTKVLVAIEPAVRSLLTAKGESPDYLRIDADCSAASLVGGGTDPD